MYHKIGTNNFPITASAENCGRYFYAHLASRTAGRQKHWRLCAVENQHPGPAPAQSLPWYDDRVEAVWKEYVNPWTEEDKSEQEQYDTPKAIYPSTAALKTGGLRGDLRV